MNTISTKLNASEKKTVLLAGVGGMLEFYDFTIYGVFSLYFASQFFHSSDELISIITSYLVFILGYLARPIGGVFFSHIGDESGRKQVLVTTIVIMGLSSTLIGVLPTYSQIGIFAPIMLLLLRLIQGLAVGRELPVTYVYIKESIDEKKVGVAFSIVIAFIISGLLIGMLINQFLVAYFSYNQIVKYGWRLPFIFGGLICFVSYKVRKTLIETKDFAKIKYKPRFPIIVLFKENSIELCLAIGLTAILAAIVVTFTVFMPTYLNKIVKLDLTEINNIMPINIIIIIISTLMSGKLTQIVPQGKILIGTLVTAIAVIIVSFYLISTKHYIFLSLAGLGIVTGIVSAIIPLVITNIFPTKVRLTGVALSYNIGLTVFGGLAPVIIAIMIQKKINIYIAPALYVLIIDVFGIISAIVIFRRLKLNSFKG